MNAVKVGDKFLGKMTISGSLQLVAPPFAYSFTSEVAASLATLYPGAKVTGVVKFNLTTKKYEIPETK